MNKDNVKTDNVKSGQSIGSLFSVLLFFLFTLCMVMVMVIGATVYQNIVKRMDDNFNDRTALSYITNKIRQNDRADSVAITQMEGQNVLELKEEYDGIRYHTLIYSYDGQIRELFKVVEDELLLEDGIPIVPADMATFAMASDRLVSIQIEGAEGIYESYVYLRSGGAYE